MEVYFYKENTAGTPAYQFLTQSTAPSGYLPVTTVTDFAQSWGLWDLSYYRLWRGAMKRLVIELGAGDEEAGFNNLTAQEKHFAAKHNIGTGAQRLAAVPDDQERDKGCFDYLLLQEGAMYANGKGAIKNLGGIWLKALSFSRADHIAVPSVGVTLPTYFFLRLIIDSPTALEVAGNLLELHRSQGIDGIALGTPPVGISDFVQGTPGTRYDTASMRNDPNILAAVATTPLSGFADIDEMADEFLFIIKYGKPSYFLS